MKYLIIVESLRIGGIERLALDEFYFLKKNNYDVNLIVLSEKPTNKNGTFLEGDRDLISEFNSSIFYVPGSRIEKLKYIERVIFQDISKETEIVAFSHSLKGSVIFFGIKLIFGRNIWISTTIHQLPSLSENKQRLKRFFYAQFTNKLFAYSEAVKKDWDKHLITKIFGKSIKVNRNGVYLDRLNIFETQMDDEKRIIWIGRNTSWKGLNKFIEIINYDELKDISVLIYVPYGAEDIRKRLAGRKLVEIREGLTLRQHTAKRFDVHFYPVDYGNHVQFIESISLNVLEFAAMGIPSLVTEKGVSTWPELVESGLLFETKWNDKDSILNNVERAFKVRLSKKEIDRVRSLINIKNHLVNLIQK